MARASELTASTPAKWTRRKRRLTLEEEKRAAARARRREREREEREAEERAAPLRAVALVLAELLCARLGPDLERAVALANTAGWAFRFSLVEEVAETQSYEEIEQNVEVVSELEYNRPVCRVYPGNGPCQRVQARLIILSMELGVVAYTTDVQRVEKVFPTFCLYIVLRHLENTCPLKPDAKEKVKVLRAEFYAKIKELIRQSLNFALGELPLDRRGKLERRAARMVESVFRPIGEMHAVPALLVANRLAQNILDTGRWEPDEYYSAALDDLSDFIYSSREAVSRLDEAEHEAVLIAHAALKSLQDCGYYRPPRCTA